MADLTYNKFQAFLEASLEGKHDLGTDTLKIALSNTAPSASADTVFADITEIAAGNGYIAGGATLTITSSSQTGGTYSLVVTSDVTWTAAGGTIGPFQHIVLYNDSATNKDLIGFWSTASAITLSDTDPYTAYLAGVTLITGS